MRSYFYDTKIKKTKGLSNRFGLRVAAKEDYVYLQSWVLQNAGFANAFTIYAHELLHQYGGDTTFFSPGTVHYEPKNH